MGFLGLVRCGYPSKALRREEEVVVSTPGDRRPSGAKRRHKAAATSPWRPSLGTVMENGVLRVRDPVGGEGGADATATAPVKRKAKAAATSSTAAVARPRSWGSGQLAVQQTAVPAFLF